MYTNSPIKAGIFPVTDNGLGMTAGQLLAWHGREFPHGFVVGPDTTLTYDLSNLKPFLFHADVTRIYSNSCGDGVDFVVLGDMREIARVHLRQDSEAVLPIDVNVNSVRMLTLLIEPLDNYDCDEAIWGDPIVYAYANPAEAPTSLPSQTPTAVSVKPIPDKMVWSYYYGWYQPLFPWMWWENPRWIDYPAGRYNSMDVEVIHKQIQQAKSVGIDGFVVLWLGIDNVGNTKQLDLLLEAAAQDDFKIIVSYEWPNNIAKTTSDLQYLLVNFANQPAYMYVDGRPVVFFYQNFRLGPSGVWQGIFDNLDALGLHGFYISQRYSLNDLSVFDGIYEYIPVDAFSYPPDFNRQFQAYMQAHPGEEKLWVASAIPGFDNTPNVTSGVDTYRFIDPLGGEYYRRSLQAALDSGAPWILITSWNEYTENTEIEPSEKLGTLRLDITRDLVLAWKNK